MARSDVETFGLLNRWPVIVHNDPWKFNQINGLGVHEDGCTTQSIYLQFERDFIAGALHRSVLEAAEWLGFLPVPTYVENEVVPLDLSAPWDQQELQLKYGYLQAIGARQILEIASNEPVAYTDTNGDTVEDLATITIEAASFDLEEVRVFYRVDDGAEGVAHPSWEIEGLTRKDNGDGTVTLTGHKSLFVHPDVWAQEYSSGQVKYAGDTQTDAHFVAEVDVYRVYTNLDHTVTLHAQGTTYEVTAHINDTRYASLSLSKLALNDPDPAYPVFATISYIAGYPRSRGLMYRPLETALVRYANVHTPQQLCYCDRTLAMWKDDNKPPEAITQADSENPPPFGITHAGFELWRVIEPLALKFKGRERRSYPNADKVRYFKS